MTDANPVVTKPKSKDEAKIEKKFKSLTADCDKYRRSHNGQSTAACEAHQEGQFSLIKKNIESELGRLNSQAQPFSGPEFEKKIREEVLKGLTSEGPKFFHPTLGRMPDNKLILDIPSAAATDGGIVLQPIPKK